MGRHQKGHGRHELCKRSHMKRRWANWLHGNRVRRARAWLT